MILGLVQGLTEFLPISSSGHLVIFQRVLDISHDMVFFDVMVHFGTLLAVLLYFRRDLAGLIAALLGRDTVHADGEVDSWCGTAAEGRRFILWIFVGIIPAGVAWTRGAGLPGRGSAWSDFTTTAPNPEGSR